VSGEAASKKSSVRTVRREVYAMNDNLSSSIYTPLADPDLGVRIGATTSTSSARKTMVLSPEEVRAQLGSSDNSYDGRRGNEGAPESMNFEEPESAVWRRHHLRRYSLNKTLRLSTSQKSTAYKWGLVILIGMLVALIGLFVTFIVNTLVHAKFDYMNEQMRVNQAWAYFSLVFISLSYALGAGLCCWFEPCAAGSGIAEVKAYLNGINLHRYVRIRTLFAKIAGMCLSTSSGLPIGKEGPMIHAGSITGAALSQGKTKLIGVDTSWTKYQDLRNDRSKRDFVTFGAASGVAAAFSAPIGGILFTLEEGASFWNPTLTFRGFFAAMMTELTINIITGLTSGGSSLLGLDRPTSMFEFGDFTSFEGYHTYELIVFMSMGVAGGLLGALFNHYTIKLAVKRRDLLAGRSQAELIRVAELLFVCFVWTTVSFVLPLMLPMACTEKPASTDDNQPGVGSLVDDLVQFQCEDGKYNQLASLTLVNSDVTLQQLFHFQNSDGSSGSTFDWYVLVLFFFAYFLMAMVAAGTFCPAGLFVPTLVSGAAIGRLVGCMLNSVAHDSVADSGTYALMGAAAVLGGMSRMTICGVVIMLEASGNNEYLLPLMLVFAAARYTGNVFNQSMYDMQIELKGLPFLEAHLKHIGLLNYHPVSEIMCRNVKTLREMMRVADVEWLLKNTAHQGFPVLSRKGHVKGFMLRKHLCTLIKLRNFSYISEGNEAILENLETRGSIGTIGSGTEMDGHDEGQAVPDIESGAGAVYSRSIPQGPAGEVGDDEQGSREGLARMQTISISASASVPFETIEKGSYPTEPSITDIKLTAAERDAWLDLRQFLDRAPYILIDSSSIQKAYRYFRTLGLRHLLCVDHKNRLTGILTRKDLTEQRLESYWLFEEDHVGNFQRIDGDAKPTEDFLMVDNGHLVPASAPFTDADDDGTYRDSATVRDSSLLRGDLGTFFSQPLSTVAQAEGRSATAQSRGQRANPLSLSEDESPRT
jgi:chloride channel 7